MVLFESKKKSFLLGLFLFVLSYILVIDNFSLQSAVDGGIIIDNQISFPSQFSNIEDIHFNTWTLLNHFSLILIKIGLNSFIISKILLYISTLFFSLGIFLITINLTQNIFLSLFLVCFTLVGKINFGNVDFPALLYFRGTYGLYALSTFTIFIGFLFNKNFRLAGFFLVLLFCIHIVVGAWVILIMLSTLIYLKYINKKKILEPNFINNFTKGIFIAAPPVFYSFVFFYKNTVQKSEYNQEHFNTYLNLWDHHRNITEINYIYVLLTILLVVLYFIYHKKNHRNDFNKNFLFLFICFHCVGSLIIYMSFKIFPSLFPEIFVRAMIPRVFLIHTHIGYPLIISFLFILLNSKFNFINNTKKFIGSIMVLIIFGSLITIMKYENRTYKSNKDLKSKISYRLNKFKDNLSNSLSPNEAEFWKSIKDLDSDGYFVTTFDTSEPTLKFGKKPYIINANYFDLVPYHPYTVDETKIILEKIYGLDFKNPPIKFWPEIRNEWIVNIFEKRANSEWLELSKKYNLSGVIVPSNWILQINEKIKSDKYIFYSLQ